MLKDLKKRAIWRNLKKRNEYEKLYSEVYDCLKC